VQSKDNRGFACKGSAIPLH